MGDRANIKLKEPAGSIYLYTHWCGHEWPELLQSALKKATSRWDDHIYLNRFIISQMCAGGANDLTGFGVSISPGDNDHDVLEVDHEAQQVRKLSRRGFFDQGWADDAEVLGTWSFAEFCELNLSE